MKTFKQPLSSGEEACYLDMLQEENAQRSELAKEKLIEHNLRLVAHIAKKYQNADEDFEELISIGTIGLVKAVMTYNPERGRNLAAYAARCIDNELLMMFRSKKKRSKEISLYEPLGVDKEGNEISLLDIIQSEQDDLFSEIERKEEYQLLTVLVNSTLDKREREIICLRYGLLNGKEMTQREIGGVLAISRSYVSRIEKRALQKLRLGFGKNR